MTSSPAGETGPQQSPPSDDQQVVTPPGEGGARSDAGVGGEVIAGSEKDAAPDDASAADAAEPTQDVPAMDTHDTTTRDKIDGIVAQTRADFPPGSDAGDMEHALRKRFSDVGIAVDDDEIRRIVSR